MVNTRTNFKKPDKLPGQKPSLCAHTFALNQRVEKQLSGSGRLHDFPETGPGALNERVVHISPLVHELLAVPSLPVGLEVPGVREKYFSLELAEEGIQFVDRGKGRSTL